MPQSFTSLKCHIIFKTRGRKRAPDSQALRRLRRSLQKILEGQRCHAVEMGGEDDHLHLLVGLHPSVSVANVVRSLKSSSSGWIGRNFGQLKFPGWQKGYAAFSVSPSQIEGVRSYIQNQREHHRKMSFEEEVRRLMKKIGVEIRDDFFE